jgi:hypothetical protein
MKSLTIFTIAFLLVALQALSTENVWPRPINMTVDSNLVVKLANPCEVTYNIEAPSKYLAE